MDNRSMIEVPDVVEALQAYRKKLIAAGHPAKAAVVQQCINIVRRLSK